MPNQRVKEWFKLQKKQGRTQVFFAEEWGVTKQRISQFASGTGSVGLEPIIKILDYDKELNARWLVLGEGEMYEDLEISDKNESSSEYIKRTEILFKELRNQLIVKDDQIKFFQTFIEKNYKH